VAVEVRRALEDLAAGLGAGKSPQRA
jgi:hypothetical protein